MGSPIRIVGSVCGIVWDIYIFLCRKIGFGQNEDVYFPGVKKYAYFYALPQRVCIPRRYKFVTYGGEIHERVYLFSLFGKSRFEPCEGPYGPVTDRVV
jgi:hypothetical protein